MTPEEVVAHWEKLFNGSFSNRYKDEYRIKSVINEDDSVVSLIMWWNGKKGELFRQGAVCLTISDCRTADHKLLNSRFLNGLRTLENGIRKKGNSKWLKITNSPTVQ